MAGDGEEGGLAHAGFVFSFFLDGTHGRWHPLAAPDSAGRTGMSTVILAVIK
jgi:hypothetical protein